MSDLTDDQVRALLKKAGPGPWNAPVNGRPK